MKTSHLINRILVGLFVGILFVGILSWTGNSYDYPIWYAFYAFVVGPKLGWLFLLIITSVFVITTEGWSSVRTAMDTAPRWRKNLTKTILALCVAAFFVAYISIFLSIGERAFRLRRIFDFGGADGVAIAALLVGLALLIPTIVMLHVSFKRESEKWNSIFVSGIWGISMMAVLSIIFWCLAFIHSGFIFFFFFLIYAPLMIPNSIFGDDLFLEPSTYISPPTELGWIISISTILLGGFILGASFRILANLLHKIAGKLLTHTEKKISN